MFRPQILCSEIKKEMGDEDKGMRGANRRGWCLHTDLCGPLLPTHPWLGLLLRGEFDEGGLQESVAVSSVMIVATLEQPSCVRVCVRDDSNIVREKEKFI